MNTIFSVILVCSIAGTVCAESFMTGRTYYAPRTELQHSERDILQKRSDGKHFHLSLKPFHSFSRNQKGLGTYFGGSPNTSTATTSGMVQIVQEDPGITSRLKPSQVAATTNALYGRHIDHMYNGDLLPDLVYTNGVDADQAGDGRRPMASELLLRPAQARTGITGAARWDLPHGWFVSAQLPLVQVGNTWNIVEQAMDAGTDAADKFPLDYFMGNYKKSAAAADTQVALEKAKLYRGTRRSGWGCREFLLTAGNTFFSGETLELGAQVEAVLSCGSKNTGEFLFDPQGEGRHTSIGIAGHSRWQLCNDVARALTISLVGSSSLRASFEGSEVRTLGLQQADSGTQLPWVQYALGGKLGETANAFPLANVLTRDVRVTPGVTYEATVACQVSWKKLDVCVGYGTWYRAPETVKLSERWENDTYGALCYDWDLSGPLDDFAGDSFDDRMGLSTAFPPPVNMGNILGRGAAGPIQRPGTTKTSIPAKNLSGLVDVPWKVSERIKAPSVHHHYSLMACTVPDQLSHTFFCRVGYQKQLRNTQVSFNGGFSYEVNGNPSKGLDAIALWGGVSVAL